ncbi:unnamed protein product [Dimorphilus gyrociliatus]|uniref:SAM domain-containing protein n=1 Tax=Dimorphilus gyrociliatus TaxID=2664684 RepID=A0A7I8W392_9ANNE|nr:unnamed protein product [Dimorphilus gyrociliatus]
MYNNSKPEVVPKKVVSFPVPDLLPERSYATYGKDSDFPAPPPTQLVMNKETDRDSGIYVQFSPPTAAAPAQNTSQVDPAALVEEKIRSGLHPCHPELLTIFLQNLHMSNYVSLFVQAGYDLATVSKMTPADLSAIGIRNPSHRKRLKTEISRLKIPELLPNFYPPSLSVLLQLLCLPHLEPVLNSHGYKTISSLLELTWEDLEEVGVTKLGEQKKLVVAVDKLRKLDSSPHSTHNQANYPPSPDVVAIQVSEAPSGVESSHNRIGYSGSLTRRSVSTFTSSDALITRQKTPPPPPPKRVNSVKASASPSLKPKPIYPPKPPSPAPKPKMTPRVVSSSTDVPRLEAHNAAVTRRQASDDSTSSSNEGLHFANEDVGTIRQKSSNPNVLNELDTMLQGLTDELDAILKKQFK